MDQKQIPLDFASQPVTGKEAMRIGIRKAEGTADALDETYRERAYEFLKEYVKSGKPFMCESYREACEVAIGQSPKSKRVFGSMMIRAAKEGLIRKIGIDKVTNPTAHAANANVWVMNFEY